MSLSQWSFRAVTERKKDKTFNYIRNNDDDRHRVFFVIWQNSLHCARVSSFNRFLDHTQRRTTVSRIPLDEGSARRRDLYMTKYNIHNRQTSMRPVGFEPTISAGERPKTYALDRAATGTGHHVFYYRRIRRIKY